MRAQYTARYTRLPSGVYMGRIVEWPGVITEGNDLDDCRECLQDALREMMLSYQEDGQEFPIGCDSMELIEVEI